MKIKVLLIQHEYLEEKEEEEEKTMSFFSECVNFFALALLLQGKRNAITTWISFSKISETSEDLCAKKNWLYEQNIIRLKILEGNTIQDLSRKR